MNRKPVLTFFKSLSPFRKMKLFFQSLSGATAMEYALVGGLIALVIIGSLTTIGNEIANEFLNVIATTLSGPS